jgi:hypothetical protein
MVPAFLPVVFASVAAVGMAGVVLFGVTRVFRQRKITMADLKELPAPPGENSGSGPPMQA